MKVKDFAALADENGSWWLGQIIKLKEGEVLIWEYGSVEWVNPEPGKIPPLGLIWQGRYKNKTKDLFSSEQLCKVDIDLGFKRVVEWQPIESVLLWGDKQQVLTRRGTVSKEFWELIMSIKKNCWYYSILE